MIIRHLKEMKKTRFDSKHNKIAKITLRLELEKVNWIYKKSEKRSEIIIHKGITKILDKITK